MGNLINPYIAGAPVTEARMFFGREDVFQWIENSIAGQYADHILVIHGQRRVGKTSVLKQLGNRLPKRYIPVFFDLQGRTHTTLDRFLWWLAREIVRVLKQDRGIEFPLPDKDAFASDIEYFEHRFLPDLKPALGTDTLLLTFDEFDNLEESEVKEELARPLTDYLRRLMGGAGLNFIFSIGSSGRKLENMQATYTEFFKTALYKKISFLNEDQTRKLITQPVEKLIEYDRHAVSRIYQLAGGHPYFTQLTCHELFAKCQQTDERIIKESDVESVLDDVVERGTVNLKFVWDEASDIEKWSLSALAQLEKSDNRAIADYLRKNRVRFSESDLTSGLLHLREKDVLTAENRFVIHLLKLWLQKNRPIEQAREELTEVNPIANRYIEIGLEFKDSRMYEKAIESFQEALAVSKDNLQAQVNVGLVYMDMKAYDKAVIEFEKALTMDDEDVSARSGLCDAHLSLGDSALARGRTKEAVLSYQRVLGINAEHTEARQRMAEIARQRAEKALADGRDEEALSAFGESLKFTPEDSVLIARVDQVRAEKKAKVLAALVTRSEKEASAKNWEGAIKSLEEASSLAPGDASIQKRISEIRSTQENARLDALLAKADTAAKSARWDEAIELLTAVLSAKPDETVETKLKDIRAKQRDAKLSELKTQARGWARTERFDEALSAWDAYLALDPSDREAVLAEIEQVKNAQALAKSYADAQKAFAKKNYNQAVDLLKGIINQDENYKDASRLLAEAIEYRRTARKWWQSKWVAGAAGAVILFAIGFGAWRAVPSLFAPTATLLPVISTVTLSPAVSPTPAASSTATVVPTAIPLTWTRLNSGQFITRDMVTTIAIDPNDPGLMYAGTENAGIYKSIDGGLSWQPAFNGLQDVRVHSIIIDPTNSNIVYVGLETDRVYKTIDGGKSWKPAYSGLYDSGDWHQRLLMSPKDSSTLYYVAAQGISKTTDGGDGWEKIRFPCDDGITDMAIDPVVPNVLFAGYYGGGKCGSPGLYISKDDGETWELSREFGLEERPVAWEGGLSIDFSGAYLYSINASSSATQVFSSGNSGQDWTKAAINCAVIEPHPSERGTAYCGTADGGVFITTNGGSTWTFLSSPQIGPIKSIDFSPYDPTQIFVGGNGIVYSSDGGKKWDNRSNGLGSVLFEIKIHPDTHDLFARQMTSNPIIYQSSDDGTNWKLIKKDCRIDFAPEGKVYCWGWVRDNVSYDNGQSWEGSTGKNPLTGNAYANPYKPNEIYSLADWYGGIAYSDNGATSWRTVNEYTTGLENAAFFFAPDQKSIYVIGDGTYKSVDGKVWSYCSIIDGKIPQTETRAAINPSDSQNIFVATRGSGIVRSTDGCASWAVLSNVGSRFVNSIAIDPNNPDIVYAGTDSGAKVSFDRGWTWGQITDGLLGATVVYSIAVDKDGSVYAATPYGIFILDGK